MQITSNTQPVLHRDAAVSILLLCEKVGTNVLKAMRHHQQCCICPLQARAFHGTYLDPNLEIQIPLQVAAEREIARSYFAAAPGGRSLAAADWNVNITEFAHPPVTAEQVAAACSVCPRDSLAQMMRRSVCRVRSSLPGSCCCCPAVRLACGGVLC